MVLKELWTWNQPCFLTLFPHPVAENLFSARLEDFRHKILSLTVTPWIYIQCWEIVIKLLSYLNSKKKHAFTRKFCKFRKLIIWLIGHLENWPRPVDIYHVFSVSTENVSWFSSLWWITLIHFFLTLNHPCISRMNTTRLPCIIQKMHPWTRLASLSFRIFTSMFISEEGLLFFFLAYLLRTEIILESWSESGSFPPFSNLWNIMECFQSY